MISKFLTLAFLFTLSCGKARSIDEIYSFARSSTDGYFTVQMQAGYSVSVSQIGDVYVYHLRSSGGDVGIIIQVNGEENLIYNETESHDQVVEVARGISGQNITWRRSHDDDWKYSISNLTQVANCRVHVRIIAKTVGALKLAEVAFTNLEVSPTSRPKE